MSSGWIDRGEVEASLQRQAANLANHLGHKMSGWQRCAPEPGTFTSRCANCSDLARVNARSFRKAPISGAAVELRCTGRIVAELVTATPRPPPVKR